MIGNALTSFFDNLSSKTKNPFLGTFAIVWLCRNWELVFALFNFDDSYTLESKITFLSDRIKYETFWSELGVNILWTFFVLISTYALINLARVITNLYEKYLTPLIYKWTADSQSIYLKEDYFKLKRINEELEKRVEQERDEKLKVRAEIEKLEKRLQEKDIQSLEIPNPMVDFSEDSYYESLDNLAKELLENYSKEEISKLFDIVMNGHDVGSGTENYKKIAELTRKGLFKFVEKKLSRNGKYVRRYEITEEGQEFAKKFL